MRNMEYEIWNMGGTGTGGLGSQRGLAFGAKLALSNAADMGTG